MSRTCQQCHVSKPLPGCFWMDNWYCSNVCRHDAGDRTGCYGWECGCTQYAKKRRLLRAHRIQMRIMDDLIDDNDLHDELEERMVEETGNTGFWLGYDDGSEGLDESSDKEDPEKTLRKEIDDKSHFLEAASSTLMLRQMTSEVERARMQMEDMRSHMSR